MRIEIDIPKEFEEHFNQDKFKDSFERIMADLKNCLCAGNYEYETIKMLEKAFEDSKSAYDVDKVVKELNKLDVKAITRYKGGTFGDYEGTDYYIKKSDAIEIVKQSGASDDVCEWKQTSTARYKTSCGYKLEAHFDTNACYCRQCGKKIKIVGD